LKVSASSGMVSDGNCNLFNTREFAEGGLCQVKNWSINSLHEVDKGWVFWVWLLFSFLELKG